MKLRAALLALSMTIALIAPASAATFKFAFQGDLKSLDPYSLNEGFTLGVLGNVYEGLTKRGKKLEIIPGLAERWGSHRTDPLALLPAQGRQIPERRGLHGR
jgi:peptide/nickel transport system substrate-binding protein